MTREMTDLRPLLKREESYAIHALIFIAENPGTSAAQIAESLAMPAAFMAKVLRRLVESDFIHSKMGRKGGVWLKVELQELTLLNIIEAMSGRLVLDTCEAEKRCVTEKRKGICRLKLAWYSTGSTIRQALMDVSLSELCD